MSNRYYSRRAGESAYDYYRRVNEEEKRKQETPLTSKDWVQTLIPPSWAGYTNKIAAVDLKEGVVVKDRVYGIMVYAVSYVKGEPKVKALRFHDMNKSGRYTQDFNIDVPCDTPLEADTFDSVTQAEEAAFRAGYYISVINIEI